MKKAAKYNRRVRSAQWVNEYFERALKARDPGSSRRAQRAVDMIYALENWLNDNSPFAISTASRR